MKKSDEMLKSGVVTQDPERDDRVVFNVPIYITKTMVDNNGFEAFAAVSGWTTEAGLATDRCTEMMWDYAKQIIAAAITRQATEQAQAAAAEQLAVLVN